MLVVGAGKASLSIAVALEEIADDLISDGLVLVRDLVNPAPRRIRVHRAGHPIPDQRSVEGARELLTLARSATASDLVFACFTGGSSALASLPPPSVGHREKQELHALLLGSGADITEINCVRKHISQFKGGRLARAAHRASIVNLTVSDVEGDPLDAITDPTVEDTTTVADAIDVLRRHELWSRLAPGIRDHLQARNPSAESPSLQGQEIQTVLLVNGRRVCEAMVGEVEKRRFQPVLVATRLGGEARCLGEFLAKLASEGALARASRPAQSMLVGCGGEATVSGAEFGLGGPNQEAALAAALALRPDDQVAALFVDTDGSDGGTRYAGALVDSTTADRGAECSLDLIGQLVMHRSTAPLAKLGELLETGATGTNVNDLFVIGCAR